MIYLIYVYNAISLLIRLWSDFEYKTRVFAKRAQGIIDNIKH